MEHLDRYLQSVGRHLPAARRVDILAELRANLEAQMDERAESLGRPLTAAEEQAWVKQLGSPLQMAARYLPQQSLIGPSLFPIYWYVLRLVFFWATAIFLIVSGVLLAIHGATPASAGETLLRLPGVWFMTAAWVTLIFAALEFASQRSPQIREQLANSVRTFDPGGIPGFDEEPQKGKKTPSYAKAVAEFIFGLLATCWLLLIPANPFLLMGPGVYVYQSLPYRVGPVLMYVYWAIVALSVVQTAWAGVNLSTGAWQGARRVERLVNKLLGFIPIGLLLAAPDHLVVVLRNPAADEAALGHTLFTINESLHMGMMVVLFIFIIQFVWEAVRALRAASQATV
ncbi:MAG: hypothetical protein P4L40_23390 [Terracidiphilus sp.]|nr:hypothetical protein [Terracidiphilus sp.]